MSTFSQSAMLDCRHHRRQDLVTRWAAQRGEREGRDLDGTMDREEEREVRDAGDDFGCASSKMVAAASIVFWGLGDLRHNCGLGRLVVGMG